MILDVNGLEKYDDEILPDGVYDIKCRQVPTNKMQVYRGLPGQITVDGMVLLLLLMQMVLLMVLVSILLVLVNRYYTSQTY